MKLPACDLNYPSSSYSCEQPYPNCINPSGFEFSSLWTITNLVATCPNDPRLFDASAPSLTEAACLIFTGADNYTPYPAADIWTR